MGGLGVLCAFLCALSLHAWRFVQTLSALTFSPILASCLPVAWFSFFSTTTLIVTSR